MRYLRHKEDRCISVIYIANKKLIRIETLVFVRIAVLCYLDDKFENSYSSSPRNGVFLRLLLDVDLDLLNVEDSI